jgi:hypothetical protein
MRAGWTFAAVALFAAVNAMPLACRGPSDGFVPGPVENVPLSCADGSFLAVTPADCPASACIGTMVYAICQGGTFTGCACSPPPGSNEDDEGGETSVEDGGEEASFCDMGVESGNVTCNEGGDGPLFDTGDLGDCSGNVARRVFPCGSCKGDGYALCNGLTYSTCSCDLPPGYTLLDAGVLDGGPVSTDAGPEAEPENGAGSTVEEAGEIDL